MHTWTTWNVNGLRAAIRKGLGAWIEEHQPDVLMLQEVRALPEQLPDEWRAPKGWHVTWHPAEKKGYSGVATLTRGPHEVLSRGIAGAPDPEGRVLEVRYRGVRFVNVYLPSGSSKPERQAEKERWMAAFLPYASELARSDEPVLLVGDLNIAHTVNDIWNPKGNQQTSGFLPHEREWFGRLLATGWIDTHRRFVGDAQGPYSWWSNRGQARAKNRGWRIDYALANPKMAEMIAKVSVDREGGMTISDHAPVSVVAAERNASSPKPLAGKVSMITGAAGALGRVMAEAFAAAGAQLVLVDVHDCADLVEKTGGRAYTADLLDEQQATALVQRVIEDHGGIDHVIHTVGGFTWGEAGSASSGDYERMMNLNMRSLFHVGRAVMPSLLKAQRGLLMGIGAGQAHAGGAAGVALYAASKSAVAAWLQSVDMEFEGTDARAVTLFPMGVIDTAANRAAMPQADVSGWISPQELARAAVHVASAPARGRYRRVSVYPGRPRD